MPMPRLLLFGSPGSGKTSLLGALAQASPLNGTLVDRSGAWARLRKLTYEAQTPPTDQLASYDLRLQPANDAAPATEAKIVDCSGRLASELLHSPMPFAEKHQLRKSILTADAILLLVDASLPLKLREEELKNLGNWLTDLQQTRSKLTLVGDLPVYVVLTKCDALASPGEPVANWLGNIEEAKRRLADQFRIVLTDNDGFGSTELNFRATAIKRPGFSDRPAGPQEPFGVAELFGECVRSADDFVQRRQTSQLRLYNLVVGLAGAIALLGLSLAFLFDYQPDTKSAALEEQVHALLPRTDATAARRLGGTLKKLEERRKRLADIEASPEFAHLPAESRAAAQKYRMEIEQYLKLSEDFKTNAKFPMMARTEEELVKQEKDLAALPVPAEWNETPLGKRVQQCRKEYEALHQAIAERETWLADETKKNNALLDQGAALYEKVRRKAKLDPLEVERWDVQYRAQWHARPPAIQSDPVPGVGVTYEFLDKFQTIKDARIRADGVNTQLRRVAENIQDELKGT